MGANVVFLICFYIFILFVLFLFNLGIVSPAQGGCVVFVFCVCVSVLFTPWAPVDCCLSSVSPSPVSVLL